MHQEQIRDLIKYSSGVTFSYGVLFLNQILLFFPTNIYLFDKKYNYWNCHFTLKMTRSPTVVSLKGRLPQKLLFKSTFSCEIVQIHPVCSAKHFDVLYTVTQN